MLIYLDTNVFVSANYRYDKKSMKVFKKYLDEKRFTLLYTSGTVGEVNNHIEADVAEQVKTYNDMLHKKIPILIDEKEYSIKMLDTDIVISNVKQNFKDLLALDNVKEISLNPLDGEKLFQDYLSKVPPFEIQKPYEFKDAIVINAIKNYQKIVNEPIYIVSSDGGFRRAFEGDNNFMTFEFLGHFIKYYNEQKQTNNIIRYVTTAIENGECNNILVNYFNSLDVWLDYYQEWNCEDKNIEEIVIELLYIDNMDKKVYVTISCEIALLIDITYLNETMSYYDKEEHKYLFKEYSHAMEKHKVNIETRLCYDVVNGLNNDITLENLRIAEENNFKTIDLDENTRISNKILSTTMDEEE